MSRTFHNSNSVLFSGSQPKLVVVLIASLVSLAMLSACSNNNSSAGIKCPGATGSFTNASLGPSGTQWTYELSGWFVNASGTYTPYTEAGVFIVDGKGRIISGFDDFFGSTSLTGSYSIISNGTGTITLRITNSSGTQPLVWGITLANPGVTNSVGSFAVIEGDTFANSAGAAYQQTATALTTAPSGTFVFRTHRTTAGTSIAGAQDSVGLISFNPASLAVSGTDDWVNGGVAFGQFLNFSGTFTAPTAGIGSVSFADGLGPRSFDYLVIDAHDLILYETDTVNGGFGMGRAESQEAPPAGFANANLSGGYVFGGRGDTSASAAGGVNRVGQFTADGNGNVTGGSLDSVFDGSPQLGQTIASSPYTLASNGRGTSTIRASGAGNIALVLYLINPARAFFLVTNNTMLVEDGTIDQQSTTSFSNSSFSAQYAFVMHGSTGGTPSMIGGIPLDRTGTIQCDGNGNLGWAEQVNSGGSGNSVCLSGTYTASANGRIAASVNTLSSSLVFYLVSPNAGYALQGDPGVHVLGGMVNQSQPIPVIPGAF